MHSLAVGAQVPSGQRTWVGSRQLIDEGHLS